MVGLCGEWSGSGHSEWGAVRFLCSGAGVRGLGALAGCMGNQAVSKQARRAAREAAASAQEEPMRRTRAVGRCEPKAAGVIGVSQPLRLVVDPRAHCDEVARFEENVVRGPGAQDCANWCSAIGTDGYGRFLGTPRRLADHGAGQPLCAGRRPGR